MRKLSKLYKLVLEKIESDKEKFICAAINEVCKNDDEVELLLMDFKESKPDENSEFAKNKNYTGRYVWWSGFGDGPKNQRILFLKYLIEKHESNNN